MFATVDKPVTQVAEVDRNNESMYGSVTPSCKEIGRYNNIDPSMITPKKDNIIYM